MQGQTLIAMLINWVFQIQLYNFFCRLAFRANRTNVLISKYNQDFAIKPKTEVNRGKKFILITIQTPVSILAFYVIQLLTKSGFNALLIFMLA